MSTKRSYITPEVTTEFFLVKDYMMWADMSNTVDPGGAPERRPPAF